MGINAGSFAQSSLAHHLLHPDSLGERLHGEGPAPWHWWIVAAAASIKPTTASGRESMDRCDALTWTIVAPARWAMKSWAQGGMTRSIVPTRYQDGIVFHAATPDGCGNALNAIGRWEDARTVA